MSWLRERVRATLDSLGLQVHTKRALRLAYERELKERELKAWAILSHVPFLQILDVGANEGQFASYALQLWPSARIDSFEPLPQVYEKLCSTHGQKPNFYAHRSALGRENRQAMILSNEFSPSSSLLSLAPMHRNEYPNATNTTPIEIDVERLDDWAVNQGGLQQPLLIKIDVQGFEDQVIDGGVSTIAMAQWVAIEVSFHEMYAGQPLFDDIYKQLASLGFSYRGNVQQFLNKNGDRVLFADALFENTRMQFH